MIKLIVGLGNPGEKFVFNRHNAGIWYVRALAKIYQKNFKKKRRFFGYFSWIKNDQRKIILLIPTTFMNLSGKSVLAVSHFYNIPLENIIIVHDELYLPPGTIKINKGGSDYGHQGVKNIINFLGCPSFYRFRIGIGYPKNVRITNFVLENPTINEKICIKKVINKTLNEIDIFSCKNYENHKISINM